MSVPIPLDDRVAIHRLRRPRARLAVGLARCLARFPPATIRRVLERIGSRARAATYAEALQARNDVVAVSVLCAGQGCLERSLATTLLCRSRGYRPTWCAGAQTTPFRAHAWVEVDGVPVGEPDTTGGFRVLMSVGPGATPAD